MVKRPLIINACAAALLFTMAATAQAEYTLPPGMTGVADLGAIDCATFSHMYPAGPTGVGQAVLAWAQGYIYAQSGHSLGDALEDVSAGGDWDFYSLREFIVNYCEQRPEAPLPDAVVELWATINAGKQTG